MGRVSFSVHDPPREAFRSELIDPGAVFNKLNNQNHYLKLPSIAVDAVV